MTLTKKTNQYNYNAHRLNFCCAVCVYGNDHNRHAVFFYSPFIYLYMYTIYIHTDKQTDRQTEKKYTYCTYLKIKKKLVVMRFNNKQNTLKDEIIFNIFCFQCILMRRLTFALQNRYNFV